MTRTIRSYALGRLLWMTALLMAGGVAFAQPYNSRLGRFQVDQKQGCAPFTVTVTNLLPGECDAGDPCSFTYGDGSPTVQNNFVHTYTVPGIYLLSVLYGNIGTDDIQITVDANIQPPFEIHACSGNRAFIKVTDNNYDQYVIDFTNDGTPEHILPLTNNIITPTSFTYAPPGTYTPSVRGRNLNSADNCATKVESFTSLAALTAPTISNLTMVDDENLNLTFTTAIHVLYRLEVSINGGAFQLFKTLYGTTTESISNLELDQNFYCFRLGAFNPCTSASTYSNVICSNKLEVTAQSRQITVNSTMLAAGIVNYTIDRTSPTAPPVSVTTSTEPFIDVDVECKTTYCYKVTANYSGGRTSISLEKCETAFSTEVPTAIDDVTAVVGPGGATMTWTQDPLFEPLNGYRVQRSRGTGPFGLYSGAPASPFIDNGYTTEGQYCYLIDYTDKCDVPSDPGLRVCPVQLYASLDINNAITVYWTRYRGWRNGVDNYVLEKYDVDGVLIESIVQNDSSYVDSSPDAVNQYVRYVIRAIPNDAALEESISNERIIIRSSNLYYPTAFTPNKDNLNDDFNVQGQYIERLKLTIFDRWGVALYSTENNEPWDGNSNGKIMPPSTYVWKAEILDRAGQNYSREGTVALIRN